MCPAIWCVFFRKLIIEEIIICGYRAFGMLGLQPRIDSRLVTGTISDADYLIVIFKYGFQADSRGAFSSHG
jgi:hypothetical protein